MIIGVMQPTPLPEGAVRLTDWGLIRAQGLDAANFLHGQLTQDVEHLSEKQARLAGYCSAKGRLLASLVVCRRSADELLLACSADLLAPTLKRLSMFVLRAKCKLSDASADLAVHGLVGAGAQRWLGETAPVGAWGTGRLGDASVVRLPDALGLPRHLLIQSASAAAPDLPALDSASWAWLEVRSAVPRIAAATVEQFVPQMVNFELVGGVNFQKGCYPGQEVVARSQYRGTLKRRAMLFDSDAPLQPGQEVFHDADPSQPAGMVVLAAPRPGGGWTALVEVKLAALEGGRLHAGAVDAAVLTPLTLPYAIPIEAP